MTTVDVDGIINDIRSNSKYREKSHEKVKQFVIDKIYDKLIAIQKCGKNH